MSAVDVLKAQREELELLLEKTIADLEGEVTPYGEAALTKIRDEIAKYDKRIAEATSKESHRP